MSVFKRIGTQRHKYKMEFFIKKIAFNKNLKGQVYVTIKRGDHKATTEQQVPFQNKTCNFKNQILNFPSLTLFYDEGQQKYQQKQGEIKVVMKLDQGDKKLLGKITFDVATYANNKSTKTFKQKIQLAQTPKNLSGVLSFQVFLEYIGQASQTSKSIAKQEKSNRREQSPFNKIANFFSGLVSSDERQQNNTNKANSPKRNQQKNDERYNKKASRKQKQSNDEYEQKNKNEEKIAQSRKNKKQRQYDGQNDPQKDRYGRSRNMKTTSDQQSQLFNYKKKSLPKNQAQKLRKNKSKQQQQEGSDGVEQQPKEVSKKEREKPKKETVQKATKNKSKQQDYEGSDVFEEQQKKISKKQRQKVKQKIEEEDRENSNKIAKADKRQPNKNLVRPKVPDSLTQFDSHEMKESTHAKSQSKFQLEQNLDIFFDDPATFPQQYKPIQFKKNSRQVPFNQERVQKTESAKQNKKIKENSINIDSKKAKQYSEKSNLQVYKQQNVFGINGQSRLKNEIKPQETENIAKPIIQIKNKDSSNQLKLKKAERQKKQQLFSQFAPPPPPKKQTYTSPFQLNKKQPINKVEQVIEQKNQKANQQISKRLLEFQQSSKAQIQKLKKQLDSKGKEMERKEKQFESKLKELQKFKGKSQPQQQLKLRLKQSQQRKKELQKGYNELKQTLAKAEKDIARLKAQNSNLKRQADKNQSFFRQTELHYQQNNQIDLKQENKRLQKQKNELLLTLQKEREKNKKEIKQLNQQIEKAKQQFKEYQDLSKAQLKKMKDQAMGKNGNIQSLKDKMKQKSKEQQALLRQNKLLNSANLDLKQKLQGLKIKICEKLNQANQTGQPYVMEVLTQLNEQF